MSDPVHQGYIHYYEDMGLKRRRRARLLCTDQFGPQCRAARGGRWKNSGKYKLIN